jgi:hypothetical protein
MVRFLSWVAVFAVIYAIFRIILMEQDQPGEERKDLAGAENVKKQETPKEPLREPIGAVPYAKRCRVFLFTRRGGTGENHEAVSGLLASGHWGFLARHQIIFQEVALPADASEISPRLRSLVEKHRVQSVPTLVVLSPDGRELGRRSEVDPDSNRLVNWIRDIAEIRFRPITFATTEKSPDPAR